MRINQRHHLVDLIVVSGVNGRMAFNGYPNGKMTVSIPQQWRVRLMFENRSHVTFYRPVIVPYHQRHEQVGLHAVYVQNPGMMRKTTILPGQSDTQTFRTTKAGRYVMIAAEAGGKRRAWGNFVISKYVALPRIYTPIVG